MKIKLPADFAKAREQFLAQLAIHIEALQAKLDELQEAESDSDTVDALEQLIDELDGTKETVEGIDAFET